MWECENGTSERKLWEWGDGSALDAQAEEDRGAVALGGALCVLELVVQPLKRSCRDIEIVPKTDPRPAVCSFWFN